VLRRQCSIDVGFAHLHDRIPNGLYCRGKPRQEAMTSATPRLKPGACASTPEADQTQEETVCQERILANPVAVEILRSRRYFRYRRVASQPVALRPVVKQRNGVYAVLLVIPFEGDNLRRTLSRETLPAQAGSSLSRRVCWFLRQKPAPARGDFSSKWKGDGHSSPCLKARVSWPDIVMIAMIEEELEELEWDALTQKPGAQTFHDQLRAELRQAEERGEIEEIEEIEETV